MMRRTLLELSFGWETLSPSKGKLFFVQGFKLSYEGRYCVRGCRDGQGGQEALIFRIARGGDDAPVVAAGVAFCVLISRLANLAVEVLKKGLFANRGADGRQGGACFMSSNVG